MPKHNVVILTPAMKDMEQAADTHLLLVGPQSAEKITDKLLDTISMLEEHPLLGSEFSDPFLRAQGFRKLLCGEYVCIYKIIGDDAVVYRVVHGATDYPKLFY